jgi:hypothetical protein
VPRVAVENHPGHWGDWRNATPLLSSPHPLPPARPGGRDASATTLLKPALYESVCLRKLCGTKRREASTYQSKTDEALVAFREAAESLKAGDLTAPFPVGCFPPGLPFVTASP